MTTPASRSWLGTFIGLVFAAIVLGICAVYLSPVFPDPISTIAYWVLWILCAIAAIYAVVVLIRGLTGGRAL